jgi:hypothetical protein
LHIRSCDPMVSVAIGRAAGAFPAEVESTTLVPRPSGRGNRTAVKLSPGRIPSSPV